MTLVGHHSSLRLTILYETGNDRLVIASVPEVPGVHSQGLTRDEARRNVIDALYGMLDLRLGSHPKDPCDRDTETIELIVAP